MVRKAQENDLEEILFIYDKARAFMRANGNKGQWRNGYPSRSVLEYDIEQGRRRPGLQTLEKIANALNVPIAQLFYDSQSNYTPAGIAEKEELRAFLYRLVDKALDE